MGNHRVGVGLQFATVPTSSGHRSGYGREIGPRCRGSEIARQCVAAVGQERPSGKPGGLFLWSCSCPEAVIVSGSRPGLSVTGCRLRGHDADECHPSRAAARSIISPRRICAGAILSFMKARTSGGAVSGEPELNGGAGLYSSRSWIASAVCWSMQQRDQRQREIDACGDAAAGDAVAVDADARLGRDRAERLRGNPSPSSASPRDSL